MNLLIQNRFSPVSERVSREREAWMGMREEGFDD